MRERNARMSRARDDRAAIPSVFRCALIAPSRGVFDCEYWESRRSDTPRAKQVSTKVRCRKYCKTIFQKWRQNWLGEFYPQVDQKFDATAKIFIACTSRASGDQGRWFVRFEHYNMRITSLRRHTYDSDLSIEI